MVRVMDRLAMADWNKPLPSPRQPFPADFEGFRPGGGASTGLTTPRPSTEEKESRNPLLCR